MIIQPGIFVAEIQRDPREVAAEAEFSRQIEDAFADRARGDRVASKLRSVRAALAYTAAMNELTIGDVLPMAASDVELLRLRLIENGKHAARRLFHFGLIDDNPDEQQ